MAMIGRVRGTLLEKHAQRALVDVRGVGYEIDIPLSTFFKLPAAGEEVTLHTHLIVREDAHVLYGFASTDERTLFRELIKVTGVGAKMAVTILSGIAPDEFIRCVRGNDTARLVRLPGVGKKTAERLIMEMRDRLKDTPVADMPLAPAAGAIPGAGPEQDAISALVSLGYTPQEASRMVRGASGAGLSCEDIVRRALKGAAKV